MESRSLRAMTSQSRTSKPQASSSDVVRVWLVKFGEICQKTITSALTEIWKEQLSDIPPDVLHRGCDRLAKTWTWDFLPKPGNVRALIDQADAGGLQLEAEDAWQKYLAHIEKFFHPDLGWDHRAPQLSAIVEHAARAAGGARWVGGYSKRYKESELQWARKRFIDAYLLVHETGQVQHLLTRNESKKILVRLNGEASGILQRLTGAIPAARILTIPAAAPQTPTEAPRDDSTLAGY